MKELTQTSVAPNGNCWQTAIACVLDLDPAEMPPQSKYDHRWEDSEGSRVWGPSYHNVLQVYLRKHHGVLYHEIDASTAKEVFAPRGYHFLTGYTERSASNGNLRHVVVGFDGSMVWDPHPSRAGLTTVVRVAALIPFPPEYADYWDRRPDPCVCPACEPEKAPVCKCPECSR